MFLVTLPLAVVALFLAVRVVPAHVNETTDPVDKLGGVISVLLVAALVLAINLAPGPAARAAAGVLGAVALLAAAAFVVCQRRSSSARWSCSSCSRARMRMPSCSRATRGSAGIRRSGRCTPSTAAAAGDMLGG